MLDVDGELPYVVWFQCKTCTHLFYNEEAKILLHLRDKHGYGQQKGVTVPNRFKSNIPLKIKEQHFRPVVAPSTSSGTDGEDAYADDIINNNNYATNLTFPKAKSRYSMKNDSPSFTHQHHQDQLFISQSQSRNSKILNNNNNVVKQVIPSLEDLKKQLLKSDIDISEIKLSSHSRFSHNNNNNLNLQQLQQQRVFEREEESEDYEVEPEEVLEDDIPVEEGEEEYNDGEMMEAQEYGEFNSEEGCYEEGENSEDAEEEEEGGASRSNQSFYDNDMRDHFILKNDEEEGDLESNYDDGGMMTPNFSMVDELYRATSKIVSGSEAEASSSEVATTSGRKRAHFNPCKLCKRNFSSLSMLKKHAKTHLNDEGGSQHVCKFCFEYFPSAAGLSKHLKVHSKENPNVCRVCTKSFTSWATLRTHLKIHSGERPFGCDECGQRFQTKSTLDSHLRIHSGSRPHICPICQKSFRTSSPLYRHMRSVHKGMTVPATDS